MIIVLEIGGVSSNRLYVDIAHIRDALDFANRRQDFRKIRRPAKNHGLCVAVVPVKCLDHSVDRGDGK